MKRMFLYSLICVLGLLTSCTKEYRCSMFNNENSDFALGNTDVKIKYNKHLRINSTISISSDSDINNPIYIAIDGNVIDSVFTLPWEKKYEIRFLTLGKHIYTFSYQDGAQTYTHDEVFWVCSRDFNWDVDDEKEGL